MHLPFFIARRYLFAKKSHNVINIISLISACGITVGTCALIVVLSVYNGFEGLIKSVYNSYEPDLIITSDSTKTFSPVGESFDKTKRVSSIAYFGEVLEENVFIRYRDEESVATIKGVDNFYGSKTNISKFIIDGDFKLYQGDLEQAIPGRGVAVSIGLRVHFIDPIYMYYPSKSGNISFFPGTNTFNQEKLFPSGVFSIEQNIDKKLMFVPISVARRLLEYNDDVTSIEIFLKKGSDESAVQQEIQNILGPSFSVKNRFQQNETLYKMMKSEKLTIYLILIFILVIISCNVFGSLSMLIFEKRGDIETLRAIGTRERTIKRIFITEGWLISLSGIIIGVVIGVSLCLIQQYFGVIPMPGNFIVDSYPVVLNLYDILITVVGVGAIGYLAARLPVIIIDSTIFKK